MERYKINIMNDERFYILRADNYAGLITMLNTISDLDYIVHIGKDNSIKVHNRTTVIAIIERGKAEVSVQLYGTMDTVHSA